MLLFCFMMCLAAFRRALGEFCAVRTKRQICRRSDINVWPMIRCSKSTTPNFRLLHSPRRTVCRRTPANRPFNSREWVSTSWGNLHKLHHFFRQLHVVKHVLHVVILFKGVYQLKDVLSLLQIENPGIQRDTLQLSILHVDG